MLKQFTVKKRNCIAIRTETKQRGSRFTKQIDSQARRMVSKGCAPFCWNISIHSEMARDQWKAWLCGWN